MMSNPISLEQIKQLIGYGPARLKYEEKKELCQRIRKMPQPELIQLARQAMDLKDPFESGDILAILVKIRPNALTELQMEWIKNEVFYPGTLYRNAAKEVSQLLLELLLERINKVFSDNDLLTINHLLLSLAWAGDEIVQRQFAEWRENPPAWSKSLYIPLEDYSYEANWKLDENGKRKDLFHSEIYAAVPGEQKHSWLEETCKCCGWKLAVLFDLDLSDERLRFLGIKGTRLRIATCVQCTCYSTIYTEVDGNGQVKWSKYNKKPEYCYHHPSENYLNDFATPVYGAGDQIQEWEELYHEEIPKIGGIPVWFQDVYFPSCPCCGEHMPFIAQHKDENLDGLTYVHLCPVCQIVATHYQQT